MATTRRTFCSQAAALLLTPRLLHSQTTPASSRPNVAAIDHDRVLESATRFLTQTPTPLTTLPCPRSPGTPHDFYSEAENYWPDPSNSTGPFVPHDAGAPNPDAFTAHRDAIVNFGICVPALTAAFVLTSEAKYAQQALVHLKAWFVDPETRMTPNLAYGQTIRPAKAGRPEGVVEAVHLAEVVQCIPFLANSETFTETDRAAVQKWFADYFEWLNTSRLAGLARDTKSHLGTSWLLQAAAIAHLNEIKDDAPLTALRHQFRSSTIRAQIMANGTFPHELSTPNPYRNTLFNLDMLAGVCVLLTTRFESVWDYELQDGPGMRTVMARMYPCILDRGVWPYVADAEHFKNLPIRPPSLLFAARAYNRPEYAELWKTLKPDTSIPELQRTFPIRQPLLWVTRPRP
jgi:Alginate lyase